MKLRDRRSAAFLIVSCIALTLLWLPGTAFYPPWNDTAIYAILGKNLWLHGSYDLFGEPMSRHLPLHAFLSYPLVAAFGARLGMMLSTLVAGWGVLIVIFLLMSTAFSPLVAGGTVIALLLHHGFILMTMQGSADLTFTFFFLLSIYGYLRAGDHKRWYLLAGLAAGLACLTRYNGAPLFLLFLGWAAWKRRKDLHSRWFWAGIVGGGLLFSLWFIRNALVFGNPFFSDYARELSEHSPGLVQQFTSNLIYYTNPLHNILPILFVTSLYGVWRCRNSHLFLILAMLAAWPLTAIWVVQGIRFAFPGYPILIGFSIVGLVDLYRRWPRWRVPFSVIIAVGLLASHLLLLCIYSYAQCNAWFDRSVGLLPKNLGLSPEGMYTWDQARRFINAHAQTGATVRVDTDWNAVVWQGEEFRPDLHVVDPVHFNPAYCPAYQIKQHPLASDIILFKTSDAPQTFVVDTSCAPDFHL